MGTLELECTPAGLLLVHLGVGAYSPGYAPGAVTQDTQLLIPWSAVEEVRATPEHVFVVLRSDVTPHNRLCLTRFSDGSSAPGPELVKRRHIVWLATGALMVASCLSVAAHWPSWSRGASQATAVLVGFGAALIVLGLGLFVDHWVSNPGTSGALLRGQFLAELELYRPKPVLVGPAVAPARARDLEWTDLIRLVPRSTLAIVIVFSAMTLGAVLTSNWLLRGPGSSDRRAAVERPAAAPVALPEPASPLDGPAPQAEAPTEATAPAALAPSAAPAPQPDEACRCERADSALWSLRFPRLSTLLIEQRNRPHKDHQHLELELAVINNGNSTLDEVNLLVSFYEGEGQDKRPTKNRPLHYGSPLRPGQAIKWHVEARGTSFDVQNPISDVLEDSAQALASADDFAKLLAANHRPVRLHGAMMLAHLGDPRAKAGAAKLRDALRESEGPYLDRVLATQADLITCDWRWSEAGRIREIGACVYNSTDRPISRAGVLVRALDRVFDHRNPIAPPPIIIAERAVELPGSFAPGVGRRVTTTLDTDNPDGKIPQAMELVSDLYERL